ncbi:aminotransferase class V-fold PLP-dependent enzyme [uncultured Helicobacter sp.]|uniref:aminotransferase class V-fold PLP-dependent enzyme n=1 Tax=uncultured Helicobacter sp. TaxID=175537 RepID=UPI00374FD090
MRIYLDNAATSFPKAPGVKEAVCAFMEGVGASPGRSAHALSIESGRILYQARRGLADLLGLEDCKRVFFTHNATMAINTLLQGFLHKNDVVVTTQMEHNALMRPLNALKERLNLEIRQIPCTQDCKLDMESARALLKGAKLLACAHINNVSGAMIPLDELSALACNEGVTFLLDGAQSVGCVEMREVMKQVDFLALSAHKGLLSPMGVGALLVSDSFALEGLEPLIYGGTGSASEEEIQPLFLPDRFESGTPNMHGIAGLCAGLEWIESKGINEIRTHELDLRAHLTEGLKGIRSVNLYEVAHPANATISLHIEGKSISEVAMRLDREFGICVRVGLHCNPATHRILGSFLYGGSVRLSAGVFNTHAEIESCLKAISAIAKN